MAYNFPCGSHSKDKSGVEVLIIICTLIRMDAMLYCWFESVNDKCTNAWMTMGSHHYGLLCMLSDYATRAREWCHLRCFGPDSPATLRSGKTHYIAHREAKDVVILYNTH